MPSGSDPFSGLAGPGAARETHLSTPAPFDENNPPARATRFPSPMDDDALFNLFTNDNDALIGPSFCVADGGDAPVAGQPLPAPGDDDSFPNTMAILDNHVHPSLSDPMDGDEPFHPLPLLGPPVATAVDGTPTPHAFQMMSDDGNPLVAAPPLQLSEFTDAVPVNDARPIKSLQPPVADFPALVMPGLPPSSQCFMPDQGLLSQPGDFMVPGMSADHLVFTHPPVHAPDFPQPLEHNEIRSQDQTTTSRKRPLDGGEMPVRLRKRLTTLQPKPLPAQPATKPNLAPACNVKPGPVPASMLTTFTLEGSGTANAPSQRRTRSARVCLRCQTLRKKVR